VGPEAEEFEQEICKALLRIGGNKVGRQVLAATFAVPEDIFILPIGERDKVMLGGHFGRCLADHAHISLTNPMEKVPPVKMALPDPKEGKSRFTETEALLLHELCHALRP